MVYTRGFCGCFGEEMKGGVYGWLRNDLFLAGAGMIVIYAGVYRFFF